MNIGTGCLNTPISTSLDTPRRTEREARIDQRLLSALIRAPARVRSCEIQALCPSRTTKQPSLTMQGLYVLLGSCLNILPPVKLPVYQAARALHHMGDTIAHSSSSVIIFFIPTLFLHIPYPQPSWAHTPIRPPYTILEIVQSYFRNPFPKIL